MLEGLTVSLITERLPDQCTIPLMAGDVVSMLTPARGGWGQPPESVSQGPRRPLRVPDRAGVGSTRHP